MTNVKIFKRPVLATMILAVAATAASFLTACSPKERTSSPTGTVVQPKPQPGYEAPNPEAAFALLPPEQQLAFSAWKLGLVKNCSVPDIFLLDDGQKPYGPQNCGLDAKIFAERTQNSLLITKRAPDVKDESPSTDLPFGRTKTEFAILGTPVPISGNQTNRFLFPVTVSGKPILINIEAEIFKETCSIRVAGQTLFQVPLIAQVPVEGYYSEPKSLGIPEVVTPSVSPAQAAGQIGFDARPLAEPVRMALSPVEPQGTYQVMDFINRYFHSSDDNNFAARYFSFSYLGNGTPLFKRVSLSLKTDSGENSTFGLAGWLYGSSKELSDFTKPGSINEIDKKAIHREILNLAVKPASMDIGGVKNTADNGLYRIDVVVDYVGTLKSGSRATLRGLTLRNSEAADEAKSKLCLANRLAGAIQFQQKVDKFVGFGVEASEIFDPCAVQVTDLESVVAAQPDLRQKLAIYAKGATQEKLFAYRGWDEKAAAVAARIASGVAPDKAAQAVKDALDPQSNIKFVQEASAVLKALVDGFGDSPELATEIGALSQFAVRSAVRGQVITQNVTSLVATAGRQSLPLFRRAFENDLVRLSSSPDILTVDEISESLGWASKLSVGVLALYSKVGIEAMALGIPRFSETLFSSYAALRDAEENAKKYLSSLALARTLLEEDLTRMPEGVTVETARYREEFATMVVSDKWTNQHVATLNEYLKLRNYLKTARSECRKPKDLASQVMCIRDRVNQSAFSATHGLFTPDKIPAAVQLAKDLENILAKFPADHPMTDRVANRFFQAGWVVCAPEELQARNYLIRAYLAAMLQDPSKPNPNLENGIETNFRACLSK